MSKTNTYWLAKVKLWIILHGGWKGVDNIDFCSYCRYGTEEDAGPLKKWWGFRNYNCKRKKEMRGRLMAKKDLTGIKFNPHVNLGDNEYSYFCVEWIKDV